VKKKRGRPKKYRSDGLVALGLSSISSSTLHSSNSGWEPWSAHEVQDLGHGDQGGSGFGKGRSPGFGKMQQLTSLGSSCSLVISLTYPMLYDNRDIY
jgi:hypothetical protein